MIDISDIEFNGPAELKDEWLDFVKSYIKPGSGDYLKASLNVAQKIFFLPDETENISVKIEKNKFLREDLQKIAIAHPVREYAESGG